MEEQCFSNQIHVLAECFNECDITGKLMIIFVKLLSSLLILFVVLGIVLPRHIVTYHLILCLILLFCFTINYFPLNDLLSSTLIKQTEYQSKRLNMVCQQTPFSTNTCKVLLLIIISIAIFNYLYPDYSFNAMCIKAYKYMNDADNTEVDVTQKIVTEFKIKKNDVQSNPYEILGNNNVQPLRGGNIPEVVPETDGLKILGNINGSTLNEPINKGLDKMNYPDIHLDAFSDKDGLTVNSLDQVNDKTDIDIFNKTYQPINLQITRMVNGGKKINDHVTKSHDIVIKF